MISKWQQVTPVALPHGLSPLFVEYDFGSSGYKIQITDLTTLWSESVERRELIRRAWDAGTSIDPSEGPSQMQLLMNKIKASLDSQSGSSMTVDVEDDRYERLKLETQTPLPGGLKPLIWPIYLHRCPQTQLTMSLIYPCLSEMILMNNQIQSLVEILREKDNAIAKLMDKLQSDPVGLSATLLGSSKQKASIARNLTDHAVKSFKGLVPFNQVEWRSQHSGPPWNREDLPSNISLALGLVGSNLPLSDLANEPNAMGKENPRLQKPISKPTSRGEQISITQSPKGAHSAHESPQSNSNEANDLENEGSTTEDTEDEEPNEGISASPPFLAQAKDNTKQRRGSSSTVEGAQRISKSPSDRSQETETVAVGESRPGKGLSIRNQASTQPSTKIGNGAGKLIYEVAKSPGSKLGKIGGREAIARASKAPSDENRDRTKYGFPDEGPPTNGSEATMRERVATRETSKERANRKREQLRQDLQASSNTSRKKRRF